MLSFIDSLLNKITMYRLVLYYLIILIGVLTIFSFIGFIHYSPVSIILSTLFITLICWAVNTILSNIFKAPTNLESVYITALILALIISPAQNVNDYIFLMWVSILAVSSKYIFNIGNKHIFNPVAIAVVLTAFVLNESASWWVGNLPIMPFVIIGGLLIIKKIKREDLFFSFFISSIIATSLIAILNGKDVLPILDKSFLHSSLLFFGFVMLTEPLTTPPTKVLQIIYGSFVGVLFVPQIHIGSIYSTPELALVAGNILSYFMSPKEKLILKLKEKIQLTPDTYDFVFQLKNKIHYNPGQYMEWTVPHEHIDSRGNRRYFTLASSPTEDTIRIGVKFYQPSSSFKKAMLALDKNKIVVALQRSGDFTLDKKSTQKYVFIAGGIGITPFRSILKYLIDTNQTRDIILFYSNKKPSEIVYKDILDEASKKLNTKIIYNITDTTFVPSDWTGVVGRINKEIILKEVPDFNERIFYLSGPHAMVTGYNNTLKDMGINPSHIKIDFFPGFV